MYTVSQFDAASNGFFTAVIDGPFHNEAIIGEGYFIIINPDSKYVSFSKTRHDICFGDIVSNIIPEYTNEQYARDYGSRIIRVPVMTLENHHMPPRYDRDESLTILEYLRRNCRMAL
jgi:hypothetical protein